MPKTTIYRVPKGEYGGVHLHRVERTAVLFTGRWAVHGCNFHAPVSFDHEDTQFFHCRFFGGAPDGPITETTLTDCHVSDGTEWRVIRHSETRHG